MSVSREEIQSKVKKVTIENLGLSEAEFDWSKSYADMGADSLDGVELIMLFEEEFNVDIPDSTIEDWSSPQMSVDGLVELLNT